jgi:hypothetical protein
MRCASIRELCAIERGIVGSVRVEPSRRDGEVATANPECDMKAV